MSTVLSPLTLASTDELIEELKKRADATLVCQLRIDDKNDIFLLDWRGLTTAIGMAVRAQERMIEVSLSPSEEIAEE